MRSGWKPPVEVRFFWLFVSAAATTVVVFLGLLWEVVV